MFVSQAYIMETDKLLGLDIFQIAEGREVTGRACDLWASLAGRGLGGWSPWFLWKITPTFYITLSRVAATK